MDLKYHEFKVLFLFLQENTYWFAAHVIIRLKKRNTENNDKIIERFKKAYKEINELNKYNYVVVNDEIDKATRKVNAILEAQKCMVERIEEVYLNNPEEEIHELLIDDKDFKNSELNV